MLKGKGNILVIVSLLFTFVLYLLSKIGVPKLSTNPWLIVSQVLSLLGAVLLSITIIMSSRLSFLENLFGALDKVYKRHHLFGTLAFVMLINHPIFLAVKTFPNFALGKIYLLPSSDLIYSSGVLALYTLILVLIFTILVYLPYQIWLVVHRFMGLALTFAIFHVAFIGSDVSRYPLLKFWILGWMFAALLIYLYKMFLYTKLGPKHLYLITKVEKEQDVLDIFLKSVYRPMNYSAGQFVFVNFRQKNIPGEFHPFSIASAVGTDTLKLSVKMLGDYTQKLVNLKINTQALIIGPYGKLYESFNTKSDLVIIAGGIGVTPFLSMLDTEVKKDSQRKIYFFYSNKSESVAFAHEDFKRIKNKNIDYYPIFTETDGHLTVEKIKQTIGSLENKLFLICGPAKMMSDLESQLIKNGVNKNVIYYEDFSLL